MHLKTRNVNSAFREIVTLFATPWEQRTIHGYRDVDVVSQQSRNGPVLVIDEPVTVTYSHPCERVLFNQARDANPFFHLYEALWMLAGRNDVASLAYYNSRIAQFSDNGKSLNGAYGYRWRHATSTRPDLSSQPELEGFDQLDILIGHLQANPHSRRAVLQMWTVEDDLLKIGGCDCGADRTGPSAEAHDFDCSSRTESKDVCCNLSIMFSIRTDPTKPDFKHPVSSPEWGPLPTQTRYLDMTVTNRSNDLLWGMLGTNYVHFTFLQEYIAARLGVEVGLYHHFTNNLHVYVDRPDWKPQALLDGCNNPSICKTAPLVGNPRVFEKELLDIVERFDGREYRPLVVYNEPFFAGVAFAILVAYQRYKVLNEVDRALEAARQIQDDAWRIACTQWLLRRKK